MELVKKLLGSLIFGGSVSIIAAGFILSSAGLYRVENEKKIYEFNYGGKRAQIIEQKLVADNQYRYYALLENNKKVFCKELISDNNNKIYPCRDFYINDKKIKHVKTIK